MSKEVKRYNPLIVLARNAKLQRMDIRCDPQWVLDLAAERDALLAERDRLREALEQIAAGERIVVRSDGHSEVSEVENDMTIDYPGIAKEALAALQGAQP